MKDAFYIKIETMHFGDRGDKQNVSRFHIYFLSDRVQWSMAGKHVDLLMIGIEVLPSLSGQYILPGEIL